MREFSWWRWVNFFEGPDGELSLTRLLSFMAFWPAAWVAVTVDDNNKVTCIGLILTAYVVQSGVNTLGAALSKPKTQKDPTNVTINQPEKVNVAS
jgi:hypothetical protein